ncbi:hypothetical protein WJX74_002946 [Apatococcus lobatus]|uniref:Dihydrodipicolinate synthase n=1 Tax=Apatococcus lobatus TaxID=904363 RepID=A0AAW1Q8G6_9CHLO
MNLTVRRSDCVSCPRSLQRLNFSQRVSLRPYQQGSPSRAPDSPVVKALACKVAAMAVSRDRAPATPTEFRMEGQCFAMITPFTASSNQVDTKAHEAYVKFLWEQGGRNVVVNGTTGEFAAMTLEERQQAAETTRKAFPGIVLNNISTCCLQDALTLLSHSQQTISTERGQQSIADAVLVLPPYYQAGVTDEGIEEFFRTILKESELPVLLYNFPANTNSLISPEMYARLAKDFPLLRGIKNTFADIPLCTEFKEAAPHLQVYVGADRLTVEALDKGLDGIIGGGGSSALAAVFVNIYTAHKAGDRTRADKLQAQLNAWTDEREAVEVLDIPAGKAALQALVPGLTAAVRAPLVQPGSEQQERLKAATHKSYS